MRILVIGAGAIGCLMGGKLALARQTVTIVGRPAFAEAVQAHGLRIHDETGEHIADGRLTATGNLAAAFAEPWHEYDVALLTVKGYDTAAAIDELCAATPTPPPVISFQNGVGNEEAIAARLGPDAVIAGTLTTPVSVLGPGDIRIERPSYTVGLAPWTANVSTTILDATYYVLKEAGFRVQRCASPQSMKWTKLLLNIVGNATCAILDAPPRVLFAAPELVDLELQAWRETLRVMAAARIRPTNLGSYPLRWLGLVLRIVPQPLLRFLLREEVTSARGDKWPSLHIDLAAGKGRSEIGWLNGAVAHRGAELGVATPVNTVLSNTLEHLTANPSQREAWRGDIPRLLASVRVEKRNMEYQS